MMRCWLLSISLIVFASPLARAADSRIPSDYSEGDDAIEQCIIKGHGEKTAAECDFTLTIQKKNELLGRSPLARLAHATDDELASAILVGTSDGIDVDLPLPSSDPKKVNVRTWNTFQLGYTVITDQNEIDADPVRAQVDAQHRANGEIGVWVRHHLALAPAGYAGVPRIVAGQVAGSFSAVGMIVQASFKFQVCKWYPLKTPYHNDLGGIFGSFLPMFKKALGSDFHIFSLISGKSLNPGDSVILEERADPRFLSAFIHQLGKALKLVPGIFGFLLHVDADCSKDFLHRYRTTVRKNLDDQLMVRAERLSESVCGPVAQVGVREQLGALDVEVDPIRWDMFYHFTVSDDLREYLVDPSQSGTKSAPGAQEILKKAWQPGFYDALKKGGIGVTPQDETKSKDSGWGWKLKLLKFVRGSTGSTVETTFYNLTANLPPVSSTDRVSRHDAEGFRSSLQYSLGVRTEKQAPAQPKTPNHSLWIRVHFDGGHTKPEQMRAFLALASSLRDLIPEYQLDASKNLIETHQREHLHALLDHWEKGDPKERATSRFDFFLDLDSKAISDALMDDQSAAAVNFKNAWADVTHDSTSKHLDEILSSFLSAVKKGLAENDPLKQSITLMRELDRGRFSLYPFAALVQSFKDRSHVLTSYRLIAPAGDHKTPVTLDFTNAGGSFNPSSTNRQGAETIDRPMIAR